MRGTSDSLHRIIAAILPLVVSVYGTLAFAHSGGGSGGSGQGHGHGGRRGAGHHNSHVDSGDYRTWRGGAEGGYGWYAGRFYGGAGRSGYGRLFGTLPRYCETYLGAYQTVEPPAGLVDQVQGSSPRELFIFTETGQSNEQLARDREDCQRLAAKHIGYDPRVRPAGAPGAPATNSSSADAMAAMREDYLRADVACLMARHYSVQQLLGYTSCFACWLVAPAIRILVRNAVGLEKWITSNA